MPVTIVAGTGDRQAWSRLHSQRLHHELRQSTITLVAGAGHMLQHLAPGVLLRAAVPAQAMSTAVPSQVAVDEPRRAALAT